MVLHGGLCGRVGRRLVILEKAVIIMAMVAAFFYWDFTKSCSQQPVPKLVRPMPLEALPCRTLTPEGPILCSGPQRRWSTRLAHLGE